MPASPPTSRTEGIPVRAAVTARSKLASSSLRPTKPRDGERAGTVQPVSPLLAYLPVSSLQGAGDDQLGDPVVVVAEDVREYLGQVLPEHRSPPRRMAGRAPEPDRAAFHPRRADHGVRNLAELSTVQELRVGDALPGVLH